MSVHVVRRYLREVHGGLTGLSDAELLDRYISGTVEQAFAELLHRHGPLVLTTCRRILGQGADADDAFQGVFLTLVRSARTIRRPASLAAWLHRTAIRAAVQLRDRRQVGLTIPPDSADPADPFADVAWRDLRRVLDEELDRLPERYRLPLVLCLLDGCTRDEAARRLGCSLNTVKRRLEAGRTLLRERLLRRGVAPLVLAVGALEGSRTRAAVPPELASTVLRSAGQCPVGSGGMRMFGHASSSWRAAVAAVEVAAVAAAIGVAALMPEPRQNKVVDDPPRQAALDKKADPELPADPANVLPPGAVAQFGNLNYRVPDRIHSASQSADRKLLAVGNGDSVIRVYETSPWRLVHRFDVVPKMWASFNPMLSFSPDGRYLAHLPGNEYVYIWDLQTGKQLHRLEPADPAAETRHLRFLISGRFTNDGLLAIAGMDKMFFLNPASGREVRSIQMKEVEQQSWNGGFSPDGRYFIRTEREKVQKKNPWKMVLVDCRTGKDFPPFANYPPWTASEGMNYDAQFSPDGNTVAVNDLPKKVMVLWDLKMRKLIGTVQYPKEIITRYGTDVGFTPDGRVLFLCLPTAGMLRWDARTLKELPRLSIDPERGLGLYPLADGKTLLTPYVSGVVKVWDAESGKEVPIPDRYNSYVIAALSANGKVAAVADDTGRIDLRDAITGSLLKPIRGSGGGAYVNYWPIVVAARKMALNADGSMLAYTELTNINREGEKQEIFINRVYVVRAEDGRVVRKFEEESRERGFTLSLLGFSNDGQRILLSYSKPPERTVRWCDLATGEPGPKLLTSGWRETLSPDGRILADCKDGVVLLSDSATGRVLKRVTVTAKPSQWSSHYSFAWSADGRVLVCAIEGDYLAVIDPVGGRERKRFLANPGERHQIRRLVGSGDDPTELQIQWIDLSPDGKWAVTTGFDSAGLWELATGQRLAVVDTGINPSKPHFTPNNRDLLVFGNGIGRRWNLAALLAPDPKASPQELWESLNRPEAREAVRAANGLVATAAGRALLRDKVPPATNNASEAQVKQWVAELADQVFATREAAEKELAARARQWETVLRDAAKASEDAEVRSRLQRVLSSLEGYTKDELRSVRLVRAAEMAGSREAVELLTEWSKGVSGDVLTEDARAVLERIERRQLAPK